MCFWLVSHQAGPAGLPADGGGGDGAEGADGGGAGAVSEHGPPVPTLGLGGRGGGEPDAGHLVDGREQPVPRHALEVSGKTKQKLSQLKATLCGPHCVGVKDADLSLFDPGRHGPHSITHLSELVFP